MSFLYPGLLTLLTVLPFLLLGAILTRRRRGDAWKRLVAPRLRKKLVRESSPIRHWLSIALALIGCSFLIATLARPYQGEVTTKEKIQTRNILIAIDTSRSMLVRDASPDRITSAKALAIELTNSFANDRIGLIAFAGAPLLMSPLTIDHSAIRDAISQLDTEVIPSGGSDLNATIQLSLKTLKKYPPASSALIILSDGENHSQETSLAIRAIQNSKITVCTIGLGSSEGGIIPDPHQPDGKFRDVQNHTVHSRLNPLVLQQLARAGNGIYTHSSSGTTHAISQALNSLKSSSTEDQLITLPAERYSWFLLPAIIFLILSLITRSQLFSRISPPSPPATTIILLLLSTLITHATSDLERAIHAYQRKDYDAALDFFTKAHATAKGESIYAIEFAQGITSFRTKNWNQSTHYFSQALLSPNKNLQEKAHYNLANTLYQSGLASLKLPKTPHTLNPFLETMRRLFTPTKKDKATRITEEDYQRAVTHWTDAITHYQATLSLNPSNTAAKDNLTEVKKQLKQLIDAHEQAKKEINGGEQRDKQTNDGDKQKGDGNKPDQDPNSQKSKNSDDQQQGKSSPDNKKSPPKTKPDPSQQRKKGESDKAFAARILKENSDVETRSNTRRLLRLRRPAKDW